MPELASCVLDSIEVGAAELPAQKQLQPFIDRRDLGKDVMDLVIDIGAHRPSALTFGRWFRSRRPLAFVSS